MSMVSEQPMTLPRVGSVVEVKGNLYQVVRHPTHNLDSLAGIVMARRVLDINTMQTTSRAVRIWVSDIA